MRLRFYFYIQCENLEAENESLSEANKQITQLADENRMAQRQIQKQRDEIEQMQKVRFFPHFVIKNSERALSVFAIKPGGKFRYLNATQDNLTTRKKCGSFRGNAWRLNIALLRILKLSAIGATAGRF